MSDYTYRLHGFTVKIWKGCTDIWFARLHCPNGPNPHSEGWRGMTREQVTDDVKAWIKNYNEARSGHRYMRHQYQTNN